jgi:hypothetical protein
VCLLLSEGQMSDNTGSQAPSSFPTAGTYMIADRGYDAD